jgi:disulfide oxidoreductase YuzD
MEKINEIVLRLSTEEVNNPEELSRYLVLLTANLWSYGEKTLNTEIAYARKWIEVRTDHETDKATEMAAKITKEYHDYQMAKVTEKTILEIIRSLKKRLTSMVDELKSN